MFYMGPTILYKSEDHNFPFPFFLPFQSSIRYYSVFFLLHGRSIHSQLSEFRHIWCLKHQ